MPELPEVETTLRGISPYANKQTITQLTVRNRNLRWPVPQNAARVLQGQTIHNLSRRGKYILLNLDKGSVIWHLGMSGSIRVILNSASAEPPLKHDHIDLQLSNGHTLRYNDPRRFGAFLYTDRSPYEHELLSHLGPEPLSKEFDGNYLFAQSRKRKQAVKTWLMDSKLVVGVGNIYANESLFIAGVHPLKAAGKLTRIQCEKLASVVKDVLSKAITQGGTTLRDFVGADGKPGYFKQQLNVYGRGKQPCKTCGKLLTEKVVGQRATVYCTHCQK